MNHDATHCADYTESCPKTCYRAQLTEELRKFKYSLLVSWSHFRGTDECPDKRTRMVGDNLKRLMKQRGFTQKQLALHCDCGPSTISRYVRNVQEPSIRMLINLANVLGITVDELVR